jgi:hypothetical protein
MPIPPIIPYVIHNNHGLAAVTKEARKKPILKIIPPINTTRRVEYFTASLPPITLPIVSVASNSEKVRPAAALSPLKRLFAIPVWNTLQI